MDDYMISNYGCVSPIHSDKLWIKQCNLNSSMKTSYMDFLRNKVFFQRCLMPCASMMVNFQTSNINQAPRDEAQVKFYFKNYVKIVTSHWSYSFISMLAEVGGYVGLLLGMSLLDISLTLAKCFQLF